MALMLAIFGTLGWDYSRLRAELAAEKEATRTAQVALKRERATVALREKARAVTVSKSASATASLSAAIAANPAWADQPVPKEVQDALAN